MNNEETSADNKRDEHPPLPDAVRESEQKYRLLFEVIDEGFCVVEVLFNEKQEPVDYRFLEVNPAFRKQTGLTHAVGKRMRELAPAHEDHWFQIYGRIALTGQPERFENHAAALERWFDVYAFPVGELAQHRVGILFHDITERRRTEHSLAEVRTELQRTNKALEMIVAERTAKLREVIAELHQVSYAMVHDMRAPLRAMRGFAELLEGMDNEHTSPEAREYRRRIVLAADRLDNLITDALNYTRVLDEELPMEAVDLHGLVTGLVDTYPNLHGDFAEISIGQLPVVLGNESLLTQIFSNLLGNAVKFSRPGIKPNIHIWAEQLCPTSYGGPTCARVWVEDNGIGIPQGSHERVFGIFQKIHPTYPGTGIGLAIVKKAVERIGGSVGVDSEEGKGSRFWVNLQVAPADKTG